MIKGVGLGPTSRIEPVRTKAAEQGGTAAAGVETKPGAREAAGTAVSQMLADGPPVDSDRVAELRAKIADGSYTLDPRAIAEKMIALDLGPKGDA
ncbi:flagellar biosynthesis anti-sigma factor FlgM [Sphingomonas cavernae]|uniref:Negative regulator of flagellin synthesis n=2 Tax=Sphingomonas cavernae TaxID=2320861 RepID=A0A418WSF7_9SPHN|nr:flagellar biosynthesis anti-sigma factor FlgM [Sphingomonas cavernae]